MKMVERKHFKTKLCVAYQKGRCNRRNCSFAHGTAELRHVVTSYADKRDFQDGDLRDKLDKRLSPRRRYSPGRDAGNKRKNRESSPSRSLEYNRKRKKEQNFDGSVPVPEGTEYRSNDRKGALSDSRFGFQEKLNEVQSDVDMLEYRKSQLRVLLEEKVKEEDNLNLKIQELGIQLAEEKEERKRISTKIKKFIKAYKHYKQAQDDLRRSESHFKKLGDELGLILSAAGSDEEDSNINIVIDGEKAGHRARTPQNEFQNDTSPARESLHFRDKSSLKLKQANSIGNGGYRFETTKLGKPSQINEHPGHSFLSKGDEVPDNRTAARRSVESDHRRTGRSDHASVPHSKKGTGSIIPLPSTGMAAHATNALTENEMEHNVADCGTVSTAVEKEASPCEAKTFPSFTAPPPFPQNAYAQFEGEDEDVDIAGAVDEVGDVDIV